MIIEDIYTFQKYIPTAVFIQSFSMIEDALQVAEDWLTEKIISEDTLKEIEKNEIALSLVKRAICTLAFYNAIPEIDLVLTEHGFAVTSAEVYTPASRQRVEALLNKTRERSKWAIDTVVRFLLKNYDDWRGTEQYKELSSTFISTIEDFEQHSGIIDPAAEWKTFLNTIPKMRNWIQEKVYPYMSAEYISELLEKFRDKEYIIIPEETQVLEYIQDAVCLGVSENNDAAQVKLTNALSIMRKHPGKFQTWAASPEAKGYTPDRSKTNIYSML